MANVCFICTDPRRLEIDRVIVSGRSVAKIACEFGVSTASLTRHKARHLTRQLLKSAELRQALDTQRLLDDLEAMRSRIIEILDKCRAKGWYNSELKGIAEWRNTLQFITSLALDLRRLEQEQTQSTVRLEAEKLKQNLSADEIEFLAYLINKASIPLETT